MYAHVRHQDGRESTVSLRHLAPLGETQQEQMSNEEAGTVTETSDPSNPETQEEQLHEDEVVPNRDEPVQSPPESLMEREIRKGVVRSPYFTRSGNR